MAMNSYMWPNECFLYNLKYLMANAVNKDNKYQQVLEKLHHLKTTVKSSINDVARSYVSYFEVQLKEVNYMGNNGGNPYSNIYNLGWKDNPKPKWGGNQGSRGQVDLPVHSYLHQWQEGRDIFPAPCDCPVQEGEGFNALDGATREVYEEPYR
ncbi:hypothetical protein PVK06_019938 [Gossypium arboreum]|uniref:Uncharacterized protein n=1 Tax=Gossypium arboreum TaxID=29729 RepID=A0ABR0PLD6_GOSAR|nr:hypothetical protein PVK06_019938 [Gossypium arboreum]